MSTILELLGWNPKLKYKSFCPTKKPCVACLSHTAGVQEFLLYFLYSQSHKWIRERSCLVMAGKENPLFKKQPWKWVLSKVNLILLSDNRWKTPQGSIQYIVDEVRQKRYRMVIIAPTGKDKEVRPWKSGYYHIGKELGWGYRVTGFDFETRRLKFGPYVEPGKELSETQHLLQIHMGDIVPLRVKNSPIPIRDHDPKNVHLLDKQSIIVPFILIFTTIVLILLLRKEVGISLGKSIFDILVSLYGLYLQTNEDVVINCGGLIIIYHHIPAIYMRFPRLPESVSQAGALLGVIIGISKGESSVYIPFLYSLLSKVPKYAKTLQDQCRVITTVVVIVVTLNMVNA